MLISAINSKEAYCFWGVGCCFKGNDPPIQETIDFPEKKTLG
jgi:hypothetical protein